MTATIPIPRPRGLRATIKAARGLTGDPCPALDTLSADVGRTFEVRLGPVAIVVVGDPEDLRDVFALPVDAFRWGHRLNVLRFFVGDGSIIVSDGDEHRRRRAIVQPAFARRRLDQLVPMIIEEADRAINSTLKRASGPIDLLPVGRRLILDIVVRALLGGGLGITDAQMDGIERDIEAAKIYLEQPALRQVPHPFPGTRRARCREGRAGLDRIIDAEIARRRTDGATDARDVLDLLLAPSESGGTLDDAEIRDQVVTLIAAGYDTTASALAWTLLRAGNLPAVWKRLREEADEVLTGSPDAVALRNLTYARAVVNESLRLHPPGVFAPRQVARDITIGTHRVAKGTFMLLSPYISGRDERAWPEPLTFDPDRHLEPAPEAQATMRASWAPFGAGTRQCIGFALAEMELVLIVARLAQRLDLTFATDTIPTPYGMVVNRPTGGVMATPSARDV